MPRHVHLRSPWKQTAGYVTSRRKKARKKRESRRTVDFLIPEIVKGNARQYRRERHYQTALMICRKKYRWKNYEKYLQTPHWQRIRQLCLRKSKHKCINCGATDFLQVHHKHYRKLFTERPCDLEVLCRSCHELTHGIETTSDPFTKECRAIVGAVVDLKGKSTDDLERLIEDSGPLNTIAKAEFHFRMFGSYQ